MSLEQEELRLHALEEYRLLDTLPEKDYDDITRLAVSICGVPMSLISLIEKDRQWFKSKIGLTANETPREYAFCDHAIRNPDTPFIISDAREDDRFKDNPLVTSDPNVVFYAGVPLVNPAGYPLGTLCILDDKPHEFSPSQLEALQTLSNQVVKLFELRKRNFELEKHKDVLLHKNKELEFFVYTVSHDLKEPLRTISGLLDLLKKKHGVNIPEEAKNWMDLSIGGANRMHEQIDALLAFSRAINQKNLKAPVNINDLLKEVNISLMNFINRENAVIEMPSEKNQLDIIGFKSALHALFQNLISNGLKFKSKDVAPKIKIDWEVSKSEVLFSIADNGIGIKPEHFDKLFQVFSRLHSAKAYPGTGLGLALCKKVVEQHHGQIWVESEYGVGTTFKFTLSKNP